MFLYKSAIKLCVRFKCVKCYSLACYVYHTDCFHFYDSHYTIFDWNTVRKWVFVLLLGVKGMKIHKNKYLDIHKSFYYFSFISFDWRMDFVQSVEAGYGPGVRTTHTDQSHSRWEHGGAPDWWKKTAKGLIHPLVPSFKQFI